MSEEERKEIGQLLKEYYNRPLELIEENKKLKKKINKLQKDSINKDIIRDKIKELEEIKNKNIEYCSIDYFRLSRAINVLKELLGE